VFLFYYVFVFLGFECQEQTIGRDSLRTRWRAFGDGWVWGESVSPVR